jgi:methionyl-tRNA formyltransferase
MLTLRLVKEDDCRLLWEWANDLTVRTSAFSSEPISWETHLRWFKRKLKDPNCYIFIALDEAKIPVGQVRFEISGHEATVDISISSERRGQGYGTELLKLASRELFHLSSADCINAYIKSGNEASIRTFSKVGFKSLGKEKIKGYQAHHLVLERQGAPQQAEHFGMHFIVAGSKSWSRRVFDEVIRKYPGVWYFAAGHDVLSPEWVRSINPRYIFFLHWSWKVPDEISSAFECVCFHMTDVPYGRGGSPLQNLILRGHRHTKLTALRMVKDFDAGPVYLKADLCLEGGAEEIYIRASRLAANMIRRIIEERIEPVPQSGEPVIFSRRKPQESAIPNLPNLQALYDFIRMLDADGYPRAFLEHADFRYEFSRTTLYDGRIIADVTITQVEGKGA